MGMYLQGKDFLLIRGRTVGLEQLKFSHYLTPFFTILYLSYE